MELNTRGRYAVMAMADIASSAVDGRDSGAVPLAQIAQRQRLPMAYLEQLFGKLRGAGLVCSVRGRGGGYRLARAAELIAVAEILDAVEERVRMTRCMVRDDGAREDGGCVGHEQCITHGLWFALGRHIQSFLADVTLADIVLDRVPQAVRRNQASEVAARHE